MGVDPWVDRGTCPPYFLKWKGRPVFCPPYFPGLTFFCNAQLHSNNYSLQFIWWMLTPLGPNRRVPFHVVIIRFMIMMWMWCPRCAVVLLHRHCTFDTTEIDRLLTKIAHINTSLNVHSLHQDIVPLPSNRHHPSSGDCLEGKVENYQVCSVQYCVQQLCTVRCTHIWTD